MSDRPSIMISTRDFDRLCALLERVYDQNDVVPELFDELDRATLLDPREMPNTVVTMNSRVRFENEDTKQAHEIELVYPNEVDGSPGKLSILAPAGAALLGLSVGDRIEWPGPGNKKLRLRLIEVVSQKTETTV